MSKHSRTRKRQAEVMPPSASGGGTERSRASGDREPQCSEVTNGPDPTSRTAGEQLPNHERIAVRAYELWEARGRSDGADRVDWYEAERQLRGGGPVVQTGAITPEEVEIGGSSSARHPDPGPHPQPGRGGEPRQTHGTTAEQAREARESEEARRAGPSNRERMVDIGRGNQQAGRQGR
jgi:hypothetical protein